MFTFIGLVMLLVLGYYIHQKYSRRKMPPGPVPLPLVGNLIEIALTEGLPYQKLGNLAKKYGNIMSLQVGAVPTVVICGTEEVKSLLKTEDYNNRLDYDWALDRSYGQQNIGLLFSDEDYWKVNRKLVMKTLRDLGFGKNITMQTLILDELTEFIGFLKKMIELENIIQIDSFLFVGPMTNIIWGLVSGARFDLSDPGFHKLLHAIDNFMRSGQLGSLLGAYPALSQYFPNWTGFSNLHKTTAALLQNFERLVQEHRERGDYKNNPNNFIDIILAEIDNYADDLNPIMTDKNLVCLVSDIFLAGAETTGSATAFALRLMVQYPKVQAKVQAELNAVVGRGNLVTLEFKAKLNYTNATILEILRFEIVGPIGPRRTVKTCKFGTYEIPKGTTIYFNYYTTTRDESTWGDPNNFRPERFLNEKGEVINEEKLVVFSAGKRNCMGEVTARTSLFLAFTNLLQTFTFEMDPKSGMPGTEVYPGFSVAPKEFKTRVKIR